MQSILLGQSFWTVTACDPGVTLVAVHIGVITHVRSNVIMLSYVTVSFHCMYGTCNLLVHIYLYRDSDYQILRKCMCEPEPI